MSWLPVDLTARDTAAAERTRTFATRANAVKVIVIIAAISLLNAVYLWSYRGALSGFTFVRLGVLSTYVQNDIFLMRATESFPFAAYYLRLLQSVLGGSLIDTLYFPLIPLVSPLFIYPFVRLFFGNRLVAALTTLPIFLLGFADTYHFRAYEMGKLFFLLFVFATTLFLNDFGDYRLRFGLLSIMFYLGVKLFAPPMEVWAVTWVGFLVVLFVLRRIYRGNLTITRRMVARLVALELTLVVLLFAYNNKFYNQLLGMDFPLTGENLVYAVFALVSILANDPVAMKSQYVAVQESPRLLQLGNIVTFVVIGLPCALVPLARLVRFGPSFVFRNARELLALSLLVTYSEDLLLYSLIGSGIQLRYVELVFPAVALYYYADISVRKVVPVVVALLVVTTSFAVIYEYGNTTQRQYVNENAADGLTEWLHDYRSGEKVTTDFQTFGTIVAHSGMQFGEPYFTNLERIGPATYSKLDNERTSDSFDLNYLIVNMKTLEHPVMRGPPTWTNFEPLGRYTESITKEQSLNKVYASDSFQVYRDDNTNGSTSSDRSRPPPTSRVTARQRATAPVQ